MKVLKILGIILLLLVGAYLVACAMSPSQVEVNRTVSIDAPVEKVFSHVSSMEAQQAWSPWIDEDPDMVATFTGNPGEVGSTLAWKGEIAGTGTQEITKITPNERVESRLILVEPKEMAGESNPYIALKENGDKTDATWAFVVDLPFMGRPFGAIAEAGIEAAVGGQYERGLSKLKALAERKNVVDGYTINTTDAPAQTFLGKRQKIAFAKLQETYASVFPAVAAALGKAGIEPAGMPSSLTYMWDSDNQTTDVFVGMPVPAGTKIKGFETVEIPAHKIGTIDYYGSYEGLEKPHIAFEKYCKTNGIKQQFPAMETYVSDPTTVEPSKVLTKVSYMIGD
ncbi:MAG: SRPBCC family protein [Bacteroidia bacterium]